MDLLPSKVSVSVCGVCRRPAAGFGWRLPSRLRINFENCSITDEEQINSYRRFCSKRCQDIFTTQFKKGIPMNPEQNAKLAEQATLPPLGDYVVQVGMDKGLGNYSKAEIEGLVKTILDAYHQKLEDIYREDIPF